jgi:hypothetical protein
MSLLRCRFRRFGLVDLRSRVEEQSDVDGGPWELPGGPYRHQPSTKLNVGRTVGDFHPNLPTHLQCHPIHGEQPQCSMVSSYSGVPSQSFLKH